MSETHKQSVEYQLRRLVNYLRNFNEICKALSIYFRKEVEDNYGMADFYQWCSGDLLKSADKVNGYISKIGGNTKFEDIEPPQHINYGTPVQTMEYIHKEDSHLANLIQEIYNFAETNNDKDLMDFMHKELIIPLKAWNKSFDSVLPNLRSATPEVLSETFQRTFELMKKYRRDINV
ncbi:unnamed protein product [Brachionus calyciflorus]|uniref:Ferritin/DPS domain-containing protein n=1 Tax=Brachionus calyciflorus TaxID=104777 RepID=A0A813NY85_9BILA|nr:unnamed protein product [Brachionus calyciflorus]